MEGADFNNSWHGLYNPVGETDIPMNDGNSDTLFSFHFPFSSIFLAVPLASLASPPLMESFSHKLAFFHILF